VLEDNDHEKLRRLGFIKDAKVEPTGASLKVEAGTVDVQTSNGYTSAVLTEALADEEIEKCIAERNAARRRGDFSSADRIRNDLLSAGVILEDTKAGTRWKRK